MHWAKSAVAQVNKQLPEGSQHSACLNSEVFFVIAMEVRRRWTGLREKYRREKIYNSKLRRNGSATETQRWSSFEKMAFLDEVYVPRG